MRKYENELKEFFNIPLAHFHINKTTVHFLCLNKFEQYQLHCRSRHLKQ